VAEGRFREDLLFRLNTIEIRLPALRERREDIPPLAMHFLRQVRAEVSQAETGFESSAMQVIRTKPVGRATCAELRPRPSRGRC